MFSVTNAAQNLRRRGLGESERNQGLDPRGLVFITSDAIAPIRREPRQVGLRIAELQKSVADRVVELEQALSRVKQPQGLLPICSYCKKVRDDQNYWQQVDSYISKHTAIEFSHSICPACYDHLVEPQLKKLKE